MKYTDLQQVVKVLIYLHLNPTEVFSFILFHHLSLLTAASHTPPCGGRTVDSLDCYISNTISMLMHDVCVGTIAYSATDENGLGSALNDMGSYYYNLLACRGGKQEESS